MGKTVKRKMVGVWRESTVMLQQNACTQTSTVVCRVEVVSDKMCIPNTSDLFFLGHVILQNDPSFISIERQHNLSYRWLCTDFFLFLWGAMVPFLTCLLGFQLAVVDSCMDIVSSDSSSTEAFSFRELQKFLTRISKSSFQFSSQLAWHPLCRKFMEL